MPCVKMRLPGSEFAKLNFSLRTLFFPYLYFCTFLALKICLKENENVIHRLWTGTSYRRTWMCKQAVD